MKAKLAFYIASNGNIIDKLIAFYTNSKYSHVELVIDEYWYSTSPRDLEIRKKRINPTPGHWDIFIIDANEQSVKIFFDNTKGSKYDWTGIFLSQFLPLNRHSKKRWFCSEWCAEAIGLKDPHKYSPEDLFQYVTKKKLK